MGLSATRSHRVVSLAQSGIHGSRLGGIAWSVNETLSAAQRNSRGPTDPAATPPIATGRG